MIPTVELKIAVSEDGIDIDWDAIHAASDAYDAGNQSDGALWAKILTVAFEQGFETGKEALLKTSMLANAIPGGHA